MNQPTTCPFCTLDTDRIRYENNVFRVIRDGYPISSGHTLIIPKQHIESLFDLNEADFTTLRTTLHWARTDISNEFHPDGYNVGINDGLTAGQTVPHLHIHLIPRYEGDQSDPRGGIRWIFPDKAKYWDD